MKLIACRNPQPNFGDDLNEVLWPTLAPDLFAEDAAAEGFLGIGTVVGMPTPAVDFLHVFSSGVGYDRIDDWRVARKLWCVRGPLSARALGAEPRAALTDGAVLVPQLLADETSPAASGIVVVPHWESLSSPGWPTACAMAGFELVSPIDPDPLAVCRRLRAAGLVLTESLHGAIVADAFGVPWVPFATSGNFAAFKWADWCGSVDVPLAPVAAPPPSAAPWVRYGRPPQPAGKDERARIDLEDAWREHQARQAAPMGAGALATRRRLKGMLAKSRLAERALGFSPARTAEALHRAAAAAPSLSSAARRDSLVCEMLDRLTALRRERGAPRRAARPRSERVATSGSPAG